MKTNLLHRLLHNDKLMMLFSVILAVVIWSLVVYGPSNTVEQEITAVPVSITLNDYASQTLNLRITAGGDATATVTVRGLRSVVSNLTPQDLTVTADTGNVIKEGNYILPLRAVSFGDYSIVSVVGTDGANDTVAISCDSWRQQSFPVEVEMPELTVTDTKKYQFGTPSPGGDALANGQIIVEGPKSDITRIQKVVAVIADKSAINETTVFTASLEARDEDGKVIETVSFIKAEDKKISVTVPVMIYRKVTLQPTALHVPAGYADVKNLVTVTPAAIELWGVPSEIDDYINSIQQQVQVDFDRLTTDNLTREITLETVEGIRPVNGSETLKLKVALSGISKRTLEVPLSAANVSVENEADGYTAVPTQTKLPSVVLYGPTRALNRLKASDIRLVVDMTNVTATGQQTVRARVVIDKEKQVWTNYEKDTNGVEILVSVSD